MTRRLLIAVAIVAVLSAATVASAATLGVMPAPLTALQLPGVTGPVMTAVEMQDQNGDGKVDAVIVTFDAPVASTNSSDWVLDAVPSGGTLASVGASGSMVVLTLTAGTGAPDTAVGGFTVALNDTTGSLNSFDPLAPDDKAGPVPVGFATTNPGATPGLLEGGDALSITFSESLLQSSVPTTTTITLTDVASNDTLAIPGVTSGAVTTGGDYIRTQSAAAAGSQVLTSGTTIEVTAAGCSSGAGPCRQLVVGQGALAYAPDPAITDAAENAAAGSFTTPSTFRLF